MWTISSLNAEYFSTVTYFSFSRFWPEAQNFPVPGDREHKIVGVWVLESLNKRSLVQHMIWLLWVRNKLWVHWSYLLLRLVPEWDADIIGKTKYVSLVWWSYSGKQRIYIVIWKAEELFCAVAKCLMKISPVTTRKVCMYLGSWMSCRNEGHCDYIDYYWLFWEKYYNEKKTKQDLAISQAENRENEEILDIKGLTGWKSQLLLNPE